MHWFWSKEFKSQKKIKQKKVFTCPENLVQLKEFMNKWHNSSHEFGQECPLQRRNVNAKPTRDVIEEGKMDSILTDVVFMHLIKLW